MKALWTFFTTLATDDSGASLVEYTLLLALITAILIGFIVAVSDWASGIWSQLCTKLDSESASTGVGCST